MAGCNARLIRHVALLIVVSIAIARSAVQAQASAFVPAGASVYRDIDLLVAAGLIDTIAGAFIRDLEGRIAELEAAGSPDEAAELRDSLRLGRLLLAGAEVTL